MFPNFTLPEFLASDTARRKHIDNFPSWQDVQNLTELVSTIVQPLRSAWGSGIRVTSGYRCPELNKAVGGVPSSAHTRGQAVDAQPINSQFARFALFAQEFLTKNGIPFDELLIESKGSTQWLHISSRNSRGEQRGIIRDIKL